MTPWQLPKSIKEITPLVQRKDGVCSQIILFDNDVAKVRFWYKGQSLYIDLTHLEELSQDIRKVLNGE